MEICGQCGVIAPSEVDKCDACKAALDADGRRAVEDRPDGAYFVQVRAQYKCKHCEKRSPINGVDVDGTFTCHHCQRDQRADPNVWATGLRFCHEVGDLAGPDPEGRHPNPELSIAGDNKWADIGVKRTRAKLDFSEMTMSAGGIDLRSLFLQVRPGIPLCETCREPLAIRVQAPGKLTAHCDGCNATTPHEVDAKAHRMHKPFLGALADDHRADRPPAKITANQTEGAVLLECPGCGAALQPEAKERFVTCAFCNAPSKIPSRQRAQLFTEGVELVPFWVLFQGNSPARRKLEKKARKKAKAERERVEKKRRADRAAEEQAAREMRAEEEKRARQVRTYVALVVVTAVIIGFILYNRNRRPASPQRGDTTTRCVELPS